MRTPMSFFKRFGKAFNAYNSNAYREATGSMEKIAGAAMTALYARPPEEQAQVWERAKALQEKLFNAMDHETPLVAAVTLMIAVRAVDLELQERTDALRR